MEGYGAQNSITLSGYDSSGGTNVGTQTYYASTYRQSSDAGLERYINAVDSNGDGGVNQAILTNNGQISTPEARTNVVEGFAADIYGGSNTVDLTTLSNNLNQLYSDLHSGNTASASAATFALEASRYVNAGGTFNLTEMQNLLNSTGNGSLANGSGVGQNDVSTLAAVTDALKQGTLSLSQIFGQNDLDSTGNSVLSGNVNLNETLMTNVVQALRLGDLGSQISYTQISVFAPGAMKANSSSAEEGNGLAEATIVTGGATGSSNHGTVDNNVGTSSAGNQLLL